MFSTVTVKPSNAALKSFFQQFTHLKVELVLPVVANNQQFYAVFKSGAMLDVYWHAIVKCSQVDVNAVVESYLFENNQISEAVDQAFSEILNS